MLGAGEAAHVDADLSEHFFPGAKADTGDLIDRLEGLDERDHTLADLLAQPGDPAIELRDVAELFGQ